MHQLTQKQVLTFLKDIDRTSLPKLKIAFLRNIILEPIRPFIEYYYAKLGFDAQIHFADFDNIIQPAMNTESELYQFKPDLIVLALKLEYFCSDFVHSYQESRSSEKSPNNDVLQFIENVIGSIRKNSDVPILIHNFEKPINPSLGLLESQGSNSQLNHFTELNTQLVEIKSSYPDVHIVDMDLLQTKVGHYQFIDSRYWAIGKAPYSKFAYPEIAKYYSRLTAALKGKSKKCLVLDLDNTMWGGIIGEDGIAGIKLGSTFPGNCFQDFQKSVLDLYHRGIILCICSKNNEADALDALENHPEMVLRPKHFSNIKINWTDKATNIEAIAEELNIGLDSIVFIDDSDFEVNLVKERLPQVEVLQAPKDPTSHQSLLLEYGFFDSLSFSSEDKKRTTMYQQEMKRVNLKSKAQNIEGYLKSLEMSLTVRKADDFSVPRISQLTQRTNQFNLTTKRYSEDDIRAFMNSEDHDVYYLQLKDKFGDSGIVGVQILKYQRDETLIDSLMLSCRVLGRGVEDTFLYFSFLICKQKDHKRLKGSYVPTPKNVQVQNFYPRFNFDEVGDLAGVYQFETGNDFNYNIDHFKKIELEGVSIGN